LDDQFRARVIASVNRALEIYGKDVGRIVIWNFEKKTGLTPSDIARKPVEFETCVYEIFGPGARPLEDRIIKEICTEFGLDSFEVTGIANAIISASSKLFKEELIRI
jgi:hypothetical protein